jgi:hypothetical protein
MNKEELPINGTYARNVLLERMLYGPAKNPRRMRKNGMLHMKNLKHLFNNFQGGMSLWQNQD